MDIVQKQQHEYEVQNKILRLRGIWSSLLKTTNISPISQFEDECSTVITWLSIQCARDASRPIISKDYHRSGSESLDISQFLATMQVLYNCSEENGRKVAKENSDLRRRLNEDGARCERLIQELENHEVVRSRLEMELEDWRSRARYPFCHLLEDSYCSFIIAILPANNMN
jgi:hypothetical protein